MVAGRMVGKIIGVLALQGAFAKHIAALKKLGVETAEVRGVRELYDCDALIIPGGESTVIFRQLDFIELRQSVEEFGQTKPIFGTCAGLILMSTKVLNDPLVPFGMLDVEVERNAFGRQADSFKTEVELLSKPSKQIPAIFIRAPRIRAVGERVKVLAAYEGEPVLVRQGLHMGATFHPELTEDLAVHRLFLESF
jgi:5'-phosphate synthase pdxT subunit